MGRQTNPVLLAKSLTLNPFSKWLVEIWLHSLFFKLFLSDIVLFLRKKNSRKKFSWFVAWLCHPVIELYHRFSIKMVYGMKCKSLGGATTTFSFLSADYNERYPLLWIAHESWMDTSLWHYRRVRDPKGLRRGVLTYAPIVCSYEYALIDSYSML